MILPPLASSLDHRRAAFSLVEITLALGIVSFALVSVLALMPLGMKNLRAAIDTTVSAQITQSLVAETQQTDFVELEPFTRSFDEQGQPLDTFSSPGAIYDARVSVDPGVTLPGSAPNTNVARIRVEIVANPGRKSLSSAFTTTELSKRTNVTFVARTEEAPL